MLNERESSLRSHLNRSTTFNITTVTLLLLIWVVPAAQAYLDPGTGSFILQTLIAAVFGAIFVLKSYWVRIKGWLAGSRSVSEGLTDNETPEKSGDTGDTGDIANDSELPEGSTGHISAGEINRKADLKSDE